MPQKGADFHWKETQLLPGQHRHPVVCGLEIHWASASGGLVCRADIPLLGVATLGH